MPVVCGWLTTLTPSLFLGRKTSLLLKKRIYKSSYTLLNTIGNYIVLKSSAQTEWFRYLYLPLTKIVLNI